jgi:hypothetical protein
MLIVLSAQTALAEAGTMGAPIFTAYPMLSGLL